MLEQKVYNIEKKTVGHQLSTAIHIRNKFL